ncbi:hypothetical protein CAEBREN_31153 [Caenorhabditis brenneri]|uniref:Uncharacterized protein n=1 Tax=Caenorhabditis brenneri TaxID=135651 RepID=G0MFP5_CAEBE|nr:hypothetical protein CAEBREN_31153 [Caenorhabditis brenneri]
MDPPNLVVAEPKAKRRLTDTIMEVDSPSTRYVAYEDYAKLYEHVVKVTNLVNELRINLIESAAAKLGAKIADTCEPLADLSPIGNPVMVAPIFIDNDPFPALSTPSSNQIAATALKSIKVVKKASTNQPIDTLSIAKEAAKLLDKATRAVIERMPDDKTDSSQDAKDLALLQKVAAKHSLPMPTKVHRHPCSSLHRPLKVQFDNSSDRDSFVHGFHRIKNSDADLTSLSTKPRARRDLTMPELETLRASRKFVYEENKKAGESKYIMFDINYRINNKPRPFA